MVGGVGLRSHKCKLLKLGGLSLGVVSMGTIWAGSLGYSVDGAVIRLISRSVKIITDGPRASVPKWMLVSWIRAEKTQTQVFYGFDPRGGHV